MAIQAMLLGAPPEAGEYQLGSRSALEWVLGWYKERKPKDPTIPDWSSYWFADRKKHVMDLFSRVCVVSTQDARTELRRFYPGLSKID